MNLSKHARSLTLVVTIALAASVAIASPARSRKPEYWTRSDVARVRATNPTLSLLAVNDNGDAVGGACDDARCYGLIRYGTAAGQFLDDPQWSGGFVDVNASGVAAGTTDAFQAATYDHGTTRVLANPDTQATGINDAGVVSVSPISNGVDPIQSSLWMPDDTVTPLDSGSWFTALALTVANNNWVGGGVSDDGGPAYPARWTPTGTLEVLPMPVGALQALVLSINANGDATGLAFTNSAIRAVKWTNGVGNFLRADGWSIGSGINDRGNVVGTTLLDDGNVRGTVWNGDGPQYVDDLTSNKSAHEHVLNAISNNVTIAGNAADVALGSVYAPNNGLYLRVATGFQVAARTKPVDIRVASAASPIHQRLNLDLPLDQLRATLLGLLTPNSGPALIVPTLP